MSERLRPFQTSLINSFRGISGPLYNMDIQFEILRPTRPVPSPSFMDGYLPNDRKPDVPSLDCRVRLAIFDTFGGETMFHLRTSLLRVNWIFCFNMTQKSSFEFVERYVEDVLGQVKRAYYFDSLAFLL